jgi:hypothetical protein
VRHAGKFPLFSAVPTFGHSTILCRRLAADRNGAALNQLYPIPVRVYAGSGRYYIDSDAGRIFFDLERQCLADPLPGHGGDTVDARLPNHPAHRVRASHLFEDAEPLQVCQGRVHDRRGEARVFNQRPRGRKWIALEPIMNAQ